MHRKFPPDEGFGLQQGEGFALPRFGKGVAPGGAAVPQASARFLCAVQMPERNIIEPIKRLARDLAAPADQRGAVAFRAKQCATRICRRPGTNRSRICRTTTAIASE